MQAASVVGILNLVSDVKASVHVHVWYHDTTVLLNQLLINQSCYTFHPIGDYTIPQDYSNHSIWFFSSWQQAWFGYFTRLVM
jgi:hypothetical protein